MAEVLEVAKHQDLGQRFGETRQLLAQELRALLPRKGCPWAGPRRDLTRVGEERPGTHAAVLAALEHVEAAVARQSEEPGA